jgi:hypothetical protein
MVRKTLLFLWVFAGVFLAVMQDTAPDYSIQLIHYSFSADNGQTTVTFDVVNSGGDSKKSSTAVLNLIETGEQIATATVPALISNGRYTVVMTFSNERFAPGSVESFRAVVGVGDGDVEPAGSASVQDNFARIVVTLPATLPQPQVTPQIEATREPTSEPTPASNDTIQQILRTLNLDLSKPEQKAMLIGLVAVVLVLALIIWVILRLVFARKPDISGWQPSYANLLPTDPNTLAGRRQQWQGVAQNSSLAQSGTEGTVQVRKLPTGVDDHYLSGWHIVALRMSQYDMYGRVNRSQITPSQSIVKRLDWVARKHEKLNADQLIRQLNPVARMLSREVRKKVNDRTAMLPLAIDFRLRARHGEVRIWFELYRRQYGQWAQIDRWEPEMMVQGKWMYETFTYTLYGQKPGEDLKGFQKRLENDLLQLLTEMFSPAVVTPPQRPDAPTDPHLMPVVVDNSK